MTLCVETFFPELLVCVLHLTPFPIHSTFPLCSAFIHSGISSVPACAFMKLKRSKVVRCAYLCSGPQRRKYTRAKGKTAPKKYNFAPAITRRGAKNAPIISSNNNLMNLSKTS